MNKRLETIVKSALIDSQNAPNTYLLYWMNKLKDAANDEIRQLESRIEYLENHNNDMRNCLNCCHDMGCQSICRKFDNKDECVDFDFKGWEIN
jgi:hypothetical protein